jgi:aliphatic nitrilase
MGDTYPRFTVAAVQASSVIFDRDKTMDKAVRLIEEAADKGAVIIGFPELFISGHLGMWYGKKESNPMRIERELFTELNKNGVRVPSPETDRLCAAAKKAHAYVVMGVNEIDTLYSGNMYMSQLFISDTGELMGVHRKLVATGVEKMFYTRGDGSYLNVYDTRYGKISAMGCGEHLNSLFKLALMGMGTQIHVAGWPSFGIYPDLIDINARQFAGEGRIFVINCLGVTDKQNLEVYYDTPEEAENFVGTKGGGSSIIGPTGDYLVGPVHDIETIVTAEISLEDALPHKMELNLLGHYTRWDILSLNFNRARLSLLNDTLVTKSSSTGSTSELQGIKDEIRKISERLDRLTEKPEP